MMRKANALFAVTLAFAAGATLTACGGKESPAPGAAAGGKSDSSCAAYTQYGDLKGEKISIYTAQGTPADTPYIESYKTFERCTGATIEYSGDSSFETEILVRTKAGNPPDLAQISQPGLIRQLVETGKVKPAPAEVAANVDKFWSKDWKAYGTVDGTFYAAPSDAAVKSLVWYSPKMFEENGWKVPTTLDELTALTTQIAGAGIGPWCVGANSGQATGWPLSDWMEEYMLRLSGPETYDKWVNHQIPFNGPEAMAALEGAGAILKNPKFVNGGLGDVKSIANTAFADAGLPILDGTCALHRQANFYATVWPKGTKVAPDGDVFAFYLPGKDASSKPVLGAGNFNVAFSDRPAVKAFQAYLASDTWANERIGTTGTEGGWISANKGADPTKLKTPIDKLTVELLQDPKTQFRFDGSDQMPGAIGSNVLWKEMTDWITGQGTKATLDKIEAAWPKP